MANEAKVLILDDDETWLERHKNGLRRGKFQLYLTKEGNEAIELAKTEFITFGIIDEILKTPYDLKNEEGDLQRWQGTGVIREIRGYGLNTYFAFVTAAPSILSRGNSNAFIQAVQSLRTTAPGVIAVINKDEINDSLLTSTYEYLIHLIEVFSLLNLNELPNHSSVKKEIYLFKPGLVIFQNTTINRVNLENQLADQTMQDNHLFSQPTQGNSIKSTNHISFSGAKIGGVNIDSEIYGDQIGVQYHLKNRNLAEAAAEIQELLVQLEKTYSLNTEENKQIVVSEFKKKVEANPRLKAKIVAALQSGGVEALKQFCKHPAAEIVVAAFEGWRAAEKDMPD